MIRFRDIKAYFAMISIMLISHNAHGQWDEFFKAFGNRSKPDAEIGIGISSMNQFILTDPLIGLNLKYGLIDERNSFLGKDFKTIIFIGSSYYFKEFVESPGNFTAIPKDTSLYNPVDVAYSLTQSVSYLLFDIREDYHIITNRRKSFSIYGAWLLGLNIAFYRGDYEIGPYDQSKYELETKSDWKANYREDELSTLTGLSIGTDIRLGNIGFVFLEASSVINIPFSNSVLPSDITINSPFLFSFSFGYRHVM
jgi:hypothetical protein